MNAGFKLFGSVIGLIIRDEKILMILRKNKPDAGNYNLVGGRMEQGETVKMAMIREIKEEVDVDVCEKDLEVVSVLNRVLINGWQSIEYVVVVNDFVGTSKNLEPEFCESLDWLELKNLPENITPYARIAIENYKNKIYFSEIDC